MKRLLIVTSLCVIALGMLILAGCSNAPAVDEPQGTSPVEDADSTYLPQTGDYLYEVMVANGMPDISQTPPEAIVVGIDQGGYLREARFDNSYSIEAANNAFCQIKVGQETDEFVTDNYNYIIVEFEDGQSYWFSLNLYNLEIPANGDYHMYRLENLETLWSMATSNAVEVHRGSSDGS